LVMPTQKSTNAKMNHVRDRVATGHIAPIKKRALLASGLDATIG